MKWLRATAGFLLCEILVFTLIRLLFHVTWTRLVGPYMAFAGTIVGILFLWVWLVRSLRDNWNASPRQLAAASSLGFAMFVAMADASWAYLAIALNIIHSRVLNDWDDWGFAIVAQILVAAIIAYNGGYRMGEARTRVTSKE